MDNKKIMMCKCGLDGHDNGIKITSSWLRDAGFEVLYMGLYNTAAGIIKTALHEDVNVVGCGFSEGSHLLIMEKVMNMAREHNMDKVKFVVGGTIPPYDVPKLKELGISEVYLPGTPRESIIKSINSLCSPA